MGLETEKDDAMRKGKWGRWTYDPTGEYASLDIDPYGNNCSYQVRLFEKSCDFPKFTEWLGHWVQHLQEKSWVTPRDLWNFVDAAQDVYRG